MYTGIHVKYPLFLSDFNETRQCIEKHSNIKFHENTSSGSRVIPCGQTDRRTDGRDAADGRLSQFCETPLKRSRHLNRFIVKELDGPMT